MDAPPHPIQSILPKTVEDEVHWKFIQQQSFISPATYVATIPNGFFSVIMER